MTILLISTNVLKSRETSKTGHGNALHVWSLCVNFRYLSRNLVRCKNNVAAQNERFGLRVFGMFATGVIRHVARQCWNISPTAFGAIQTFATVSATSSLNFLALFRTHPSDL